MSIFKETFPDFVQDELSNRQDRLNNPNKRFELNTYQSTRNSFIRMTSGVDVDGRPDLAKRYILQGGTLSGTSYKAGVGISFDKNAYSSNSDKDERYIRGIRPMPGIVGMTAECKTAYGSLIEATVKFVCWDIKQLEDLELLYMRPGYTVLLEWGWAYNGQQPQFYDILDKKEINFDKTNVELFKQCQKNKGNYEAILGYVKNYQWSARPDGGYDCTTYIISLGEVLESLKINYAPLNISLEETSDDRHVGLLKTFALSADSKTVYGISPTTDKQIIKDQYSKGILSGLLAEIQEFASTTYFPEASSMTGFSKYPDLYLKSFKGKWLPYSIFKKYWGFKNVQNYQAPFPSILKDQYSYYITLESLCDLVNEYVIPKNTNNKDNSTLVEIKTTSREYSGNKAKGLECIAHPLQVSTDPTRCLIKADLWINRGSAILGDAINAANTPIPAQTVSTSVNQIIYETNAEDIVLTFLKFLTRLNPNYPTSKASLIHEFQQFRIQIENTIQSIDRSSDGNTIVYNFTQNAGNGNLFDKSITTAPTGQLGFNILKYMGYSSPEALYNDIYSIAVNKRNGYYQNYPEPFRTFIDNNKANIIDAIASNLIFDNTIGGDVQHTGFVTAHAQYLEKKLTGNIIQDASKAAEKSLKGLNNLKDYFVDGSNYTRGNISNIYLDIDYLQFILTNPSIESKDPSGKNIINLVDFFKTICQTVQECTGNLNNFNVHIDGRDNKGRIVDLNVTPDSTVSNLFKIELHNTKSTVRNYKLESKIFPEQGAIIAISAQNYQYSGQLGYDNSTLTSYNQGIKDRLKPKILAPLVDPTIDPKTLLETLLNSFVQLNNYFSSLSDDSPNTKYGPGNYNNALRDMLGFLSSLDPLSIQQFTGIIPITLSMDMDGIGGIVIGNLFKINDNVLPAGYKGAYGIGRQLGFLVKGFSHKIENNDWITTMEAYPFLIPENINLSNPGETVTYWNQFFKIGKLLTPSGKIHSPTTSDYTKDFLNAKVTDENKASEATTIAKTIIKNKSIYDSISKATNVPWYVVGIIHYREKSDFDFKVHLHNGDSLTAKTVNEPKSRPTFNPKRGTIEPSISNPYSFIESATDALIYKGISKKDFSTIPGILNALESYNGLGYTQYALKSPYLWSGTDLYSRGKYTSDGYVDGTAIDKQMGAVPIIKALQDLKVQIP
jgi:lysozyme family protein